MNRRFYGDGRRVKKLHTSNDPTLVKVFEDAWLDVQPPGPRLVAFCFGVNLHPDVSQWRSRVVAAGGSISNSILLATNSIVNWAYRNGLRDKTNTNHAIRFWLPLCTETFNGLFIPIWHPIANAVCTNNNFVAADYDRQSGLQGANTKYIGSGVLTTHLSSNFSAYLAADSFTDLAEDPSDVGYASQAGDACYSSLNIKWTNNNAYFDHPNGGEIVVANSSSIGFFQGIRDGNNVYLYKNTTQLATNTVTPTSTIPSGREYKLFNFSEKRFQGFLIGSGGITATMANSFATQYLAWKAAVRASTSTLHPDTATWQSRVLAAGGSISPNVLSATDTLVRWAYANGLRDNTNTNHLIRFWLPLCTENFNGLLIPIWHPIANAVCTNNNFVAEDYTRQSGLQGSGTKYLGSGVTTTHLGATSSSAYLAADSAIDLSEDAVAIGCGDLPNWVSALLCKYLDGTAYFQHPIGLTAFAAAGSSQAFYYGIRDGNNGSLYRGTTLLDTRSSTPTGSISAGIEYTLFAFNSVQGGVSSFSAKRFFGFLAGGGGITAAMATSFATQYLAWKAIVRA